jgi:hypothetical protein
MSIWCLMLRLRQVIKIIMRYKILLMRAYNWTQRRHQARGIIQFSLCNYQVLELTIVLWNVLKPLGSPHISSIVPDRGRNSLIPRQERLILSKIIKTLSEMSIFLGMEPTDFKSHRGSLWYRLAAASQDPLMRSTVPLTPEEQMATTSMFWI